MAWLGSRRFVRFVHLDLEQPSSAVAEQGPRSEHLQRQGVRTLPHGRATGPEDNRHDECVVQPDVIGNVGIGLGGRQRRPSRDQAHPNECFGPSG